MTSHHHAFLVLLCASGVLGFASDANIVFGKFPSKYEARQKLKRLTPPTPTIRPTQFPSSTTARTSVAPPPPSSSDNATFFANADEGDQQPSHSPDEFWKVREGDICNPKAFPVPAVQADEFFSCLKPTEDPFNWPWQDIGVWSRQKCKHGRLFSPQDKVCRSERTVRRQQVEFCIRFPSLCGPGAVGPVVQPVVQQPVAPVYQPSGAQSQLCINVPCESVQPIPQPYPQPVVPVAPVTVPVLQPSQPVVVPSPQPYVPPQPVVPMPCPLAPGGSSGGVVGGVCSWMLAPLAVSTSPYHFLQCAPASPGLYCGRWIQMPCAPATKFDVTVQVCVHDESAAPAPAVVVPTQPVYPVVPQPAPPYVVPSPQPAPTASICTTGTVPLGTCNAYNQCPGYSTCQLGVNICCQPTVMSSAAASSSYQPIPVAYPAPAPVYSGSSSAGAYANAQTGGAYGQQNMGPYGQQPQPATYTQQQPQPATYGQQPQLATYGQPQQPTSGAYGQQAQMYRIGAYGQKSSSYGKK